MNAHVFCLAIALGITSQADSVTLQEQIDGAASGESARRSIESERPERISRRCSSRRPTRSSSTFTTRTTVALSPAKDSAADVVDYLLD